MTTRLHPVPIWVHGVFRAVFTFTSNGRFPEALHFGCLKQLGQQCVRSEQHEHEQAGRTLPSGVWGLSAVCLSNAIGSSYFESSDDTMIGRDVEGIGHGTSPHLAEGTEENHEIPQSL